MHGGLSVIRAFDAAHPELTLNESCSLSVLDAESIIYVARVPTHRIMTMAITVGTRLPAYATSMGRVLLADRPPGWLENYFADSPFTRLTDRTTVEGAGLRRVLARVRRQGYCVVDQELELGLFSLAMPVRE